jgi:hypothetical protein
MQGIPLAVDLVLLALATGAVVDVWLNGSIFASARARVEAWEGFLAELLGCGFCLTYQVALWLTGLAWLPALLLEWPWVLAPRALLVGLAAGRLAWLVDRAVLGQDGYQRGSDTQIYPEEEPDAEEDL